MGIDAQSKARFNLREAQVLLVERATMDMDILVQILVGIGAKQLTRCESGEEAKGRLARDSFDLVIVGSVLDDEDGYDLVHWVRRSASEANKYVPLIVVSGHTPASHVTKARDCGAHIIVAKPLTPIALIERIIWVARESRPFVLCDTYAGPDRRFKFEGPPGGVRGRRAGDVDPAVGLAKEPNMSQNEIDALMQPRKISL